jgi:hypothetical protein
MVEGAGMKTQLQLWSHGRDRRTIDARFDAFDERNPWVWQLFERHALRLIQRGRRHFSSDAILHVIRYEVAANTNSDDGFKINNDFSSRYARKFVQAHPEHAEFFATRRLSA